MQLVHQQIIIPIWLLEEYLFLVINQHCESLSYLWSDSSSSDDGDELTNRLDSGIIVLRVGR